MTNDSLTGFVIINKETGITSHHLLEEIGKMMSVDGSKVKCGHAGTLDSFASGVLICLFGRYTRLSDWFMCTHKAYEAEILFGQETDTLDPLGNVVATSNIPSLQEIEAVLPKFRGQILQAPPAYSSVHINGKRAWQRALDGEEVKPELRPITISKLELLSYEAPRAKVLVHCSKGTYIRSLARDIAKEAGYCAHLSALTRIFSGPFTVQNAIKASELTRSCVKELSPSLTEQMDLVNIYLNSNDEKMFVTGFPLYKLSFSKHAKYGDGEYAFFSKTQKFLGIAKLEDEKWSYSFVMGKS